MHEEIFAYIENMEETELVALCKEIYDFKHLTGKSNSKTKILELCTKFNCNNVRLVEEEILQVSSNKLNKAILLLLEECPYKFLRIAEKEN